MLLTSSIHLINAPPNNIDLLLPAEGKSVSQILRSEESRAHNAEDERSTTT